MGDSQKDNGLYMNLFPDDRQLFAAIDAVSMPCADFFQSLLVTWDKTDEQYLLCVDIVTEQGHGESKHGLVQSCAGTVTVGQLPCLPGKVDEDAFKRLRKEASLLVQRLRSWYPEVRRDMGITR